MSVLAPIRRLIPRQGGGTELIECRRCGTTLDDTDDECPSCGSDEVAHFDL